MSAAQTVAETPLETSSPAPGSSAARPVKAPETKAPPLARFTATLRIDDRPGGKRFQGVWLHTGDEKLLVDYRANPWWTSFDEHEVAVTGEYWSPDPNAQQIMARHFRVATLAVVDPSAKPVPHYIKLGAVQTLTGTVAREHGEAGSKAEGQTWTVFAAAGTRYSLAQPPADLQIGGEVEVQARLATPSPFVAHRGGDQLWILDHKSVSPPS